MRKITIATLTAIGLAAAYATPASAGVIDYAATNYTGGSCKHGLYTGNIGSGCNRRYSFQDGTTFSYDTDAQTATLTGTAINGSGQVATLDLNFSDFLETIDGTNFDYKNGGGNFNPVTDTPDIDFFTNGSGTISIDGAVYTVNPNDPFAGNTTLQFGNGANDKNKNFGGSAWLNILNPHGNAVRHWDINFNLDKIPSEVPEPGALGLLGLAVGGLWVGTRRRRKKLAA
ncbi:MAG: PEP-CTERM sorting domain-containing protein [Parasphingorhabdus sp.]|uniref:PEP-CTERM sorting domain-containing protein n=1 Tax=Parasphingorhabdus sp. TaxID=2709688 RepID=UPI00329A2DC2